MKYDSRSNYKPAVANTLGVFECSAGARILFELLASVARMTTGSSGAAPEEEEKKEQQEEKVEQVSGEGKFGGAVHFNGAREAIADLKRELEACAKEGRPEFSDESGYKELTALFVAQAEVLSSYVELAAEVARA